MWFNSVCNTEVMVISIQSDTCVISNILFYIFDSNAHKPANAHGPELATVELAPNGFRGNPQGLRGL